MKIKDLAALVSQFPPEMDIAFYDVHSKGNGYSLSKTLLMEVHEYKNGYREVRTSIEEDYTE